VLAEDDCVSVGLGEPLGQHPKRFRDEFLAQSTYERWWDPPVFTTRFFVTEHAFTILTSSGDAFLDDLSAHLQRQYFQLHILAHIMKSGFALHRENLFRTAKKFGSRVAAGHFAKADKQLGAYLRFVRANRVYAVSGQEQGQELFDRICHAIGLAELEQETAKMADMLLKHSDNSHTKEVADGTLRLAIIGSVGMALGLVFGFWGMNFFSDQTRWLRDLSGGILFLLSVVLSVVIAFVVARTWRGIDRWLRGSKDLKDDVL
jgi:Mg2+ and Co2+ transporter CorA